MPSLKLFLLPLLQPMKEENCNPICHNQCPAISKANKCENKLSFLSFKSYLTLLCLWIISHVFFAPIKFNVNIIIVGVVVLYNIPLRDLSIIIFKAIIRGLNSFPIRGVVVDTIFVKKNFAGGGSERPHPRHSIYIFDPNTNRVKKTQLYKTNKFFPHQKPAFVVSSTNIIYIKFLAFFFSTTFSPSFVRI